MRRIKLRWAVLIAVICLFSSSVTVPVYGTTKEEAVAEGKMLPKFKLAMPSSPEVKAYLKVEDGADFSVNQINAKLILIEVFSALCHDCNKNAPYVNKLYNIISKDPDLNKDIVLLGIGVGNNAKLVDVYQKKYNVNFPLFPDPKSEIDDMLTGISTPTLIISDNTGKVLFLHGGILDDMDFILEVIRSFHNS